MLSVHAIQQPSKSLKRREQTVYDKLEITSLKREHLTSHDGNMFIFSYKAHFWHLYALSVINHLTGVKSTHPANSYNRTK